MKGISVIVPVYNEEKILSANIRKLARFLSGMRVKYEIIISDNGSTDRTDEIARRLVAESRGKVRLLTLANRGVGYAFKAAVAVARYDKLISIDADLTVDYRSFIPECAMLLGTNSIIIGSKTVGSQRRPLTRKLLSAGFIALTHLMLGIRLTDHSIGAKGYRRNDIMPFLSDIDRGSFYVTMLVYKISKAGKRYAEIPVVCDDRRKSKFSISKETLYRFKSLVSFWLREKLEYAA
ncbi:MAG: glycosyltransferase [Candidatus Aenigmarchaeota archaeon]|nr:glycosyltransferase [Candidatus Aenigmarchaeota archaeon]